MPLDTETIRNSVRKTGRLVIADEAGPTAGFSAEVAAVATEERGHIRAAQGAGETGLRPAGADTLRELVLENHVFPDRNRIIAGIREVLQGGRPAAAA